MKKETLVCECTVIHQEVIDKIKLPEEELLYLSKQFTNGSDLLITK